MKYKDMPLDDVWAAARFIWENTPNISDREMVEELTIHFGDDAPKSNGTISKKRNKEGWEKVKTVRKVEPVAEPVEPKPSKQAKKRNQLEPRSEVVPSKTNNVEAVEPRTSLEPMQQKIVEIYDKVVMDSKARAAIIQKTRRRFARLGHLADKGIEITEQMIHDVEFGGDGEEIQKALVLTDSIATTLDKFSRSMKMIAEVEMPLCGIAPEDFKESEQDRRLGALDKLKGIDIAERAARDKMLPELKERLRRMEQMDESGVALDDLDAEMDSEIDEIDYTAVDD